MTKFHKMPKSKVGKLKTCEICGDEQIALCIEAGECLQQEQLTLAYMRSHTTGNVKYIENFNILQLSMMDFLFTQKLRYAQMHLNETEEFTASDGSKHRREKIGNDYIYMLMNMLDKLNKRLPDMQLTKQTQENIDVAWAELAKADINAEKAVETKLKIISDMANWRKAQASAVEMEQLDDAIKQHRTLEDAADEDNADTTIGDIGGNPFGNGR